MLNIKKQVCYIMYYSCVTKHKFLSSYLYSIRSYNYYDKYEILASETIVTVIDQLN